MNIISKEKIFLKKYNKKKYILFITIALALIILFKVFFFRTDGMENAGILKVYYKTYTEKSGWSTWSKNGITSGNMKDNIKAFKIKLGNDDAVIYSTYSKEEKWSDNYVSDEDDNVNTKNSINAIKISLFYGTNISYDLCYRTYNKKNKWLEWTCNNDGINGNIKENITAIQIKVIPKNIVRNEYLKDYNLNKNKSSIGF